MCCTTYVHGMYTGSTGGPLMLREPVRRRFFFSHFTTPLQARNTIRAYLQEAFCSRPRPFRALVIESFSQSKSADPANAIIFYYHAAGTTSTHEEDYCI
jgi:hypothetical protein